MLDCLSEALYQQGSNPTDSMLGDYIRIGLIITGPKNHVKFGSQTTSNGLSDSWHTRFLLL